MKTANQRISEPLLQSLVLYYPWAAKYLQAAREGRNPEHEFVTEADREFLTYLKTHPTLVSAQRQRLREQSFSGRLSISRMRMLSDSRSDCGAKTVPLLELLALASSQEANMSNEMTTAHTQAAIDVGEGT